MNIKSSRDPFACAHTDSILLAIMLVSKQAKIEQLAAAQQMTDTHHSTVQQSPQHKDQIQS